MDRVELYHEVKRLLCKYGIIPNNEKDYEGVVIELLELISISNGLVSHKDIL